MVSHDLSIQDIAEDRSLTAEYQRYLVRAGLLDPIYRASEHDTILLKEADGILGPETEAAIYYHRDNFRSDIEIPDAYDLVEFADDKVEAIIMAMQNNGFHISRIGFNIVYLEGVNKDFTLNDNEPDRWNDLRLLIHYQGGKWAIHDAWPATTSPGEYYTKRPMNRLGAARIVPGQYKAWRMGRHNGVHPALQQVGPIFVTRDFNKNFVSSDDKIYIANATINQHSTRPNMAPPDKVGKWSAGCLVGQNYSDHLRFLALLRNDPRYDMNAGYKFITTIISGKDIL